MEAPVRVRALVSSSTSVVDLVPSRSAQDAGFEQRYARYTAGRHSCWACCPSAAPGPSSSETPQVGQLGQRSERRGPPGRG
ncbi:hypothetical protein [Streptomyces reniochalinae]|uniref:Uncharacterized protein n=1 Tax=Streptomyces reniochalinae TaxID=2250578 RepID=A0A367E7J2_9ACTN|nr:hypothetical protein [Streptomyces reniochalinae]RCG13712.1 hypothetical protein DQ392_30875 [Streptomyces reniochalinae]